MTKRGASDAPVVVADTGRVADFPTVCDNGFTLHHVGSVDQRAGRGRFPGEPPSRDVNGAARLSDAGAADTPRQAVFLGKGGPLTTIAHTNNPPGGEFISEFVVADSSVNSRGEVALAIELDNSGFDQGLFVGSKDGTFDERFRNSTSEFDSPSSTHVAQRAWPDRLRGQRDRALQSRRHLQDDRGQQRRPIRVVRSRR